MRNIFELLDALCEAYDHPDHKKQDIDGDGTAETFCNYAVHYVAMKMGYAKFKGLNANGILKKMMADTEWKEVNLSDVQALANRGYMVVAARADQPHGHVCVARPGVEANSGKWGGFVPKCMNVGANNFIGMNEKKNIMTMAWAFKEKPRCFALGY